MDRRGNWLVGPRSVEEAEDQSEAGQFPAWETEKVWEWRHEGIFGEQDKRNQENWLHIIIKSDYTPDSLLEALQQQNYPFSIWQKAKVFLCKNIRAGSGGEVGWGEGVALWNTKGSSESVGLKSWDPPNPIILLSNKADF